MCLKKNPAERPRAKDVVQMLKNAKSKLNNVNGHGEAFRNMIE